MSCMDIGRRARLGSEQEYLRTLENAEKVNSDDLRGRFPGLDEIAPGLELWALFGASGQPILLSDARDRALAGAIENDLVTVAIH